MGTKSTQYFKAKNITRNKNSKTFPINSVKYCNGSQHQSKFIYPILSSEDKYLCLWYIQSLNQSQLLFSVLMFSISLID